MGCQLFKLIPIIHPPFIQPSTQPQKTQPRKPKRKDTQVPQPSDPIENVADEAIYKELGESLVRAATTASSLEAEQDSDVQTRFETTSKQFNDPPLSKLNTFGSGEDNMQLMDSLCEFNPTIYASFIKQFWTTTTSSTNVNGEVELTASIDGQAKTITEASLRRHLKLEDNGGITSLPNIEIFEQLALMGYATDSDKLTFQKGNFSPQWRFFIHTILYCLSPKKTSWEQFSSNIATAIICLATTRTFNFSKFIFDAMLTNKVGSLENELKNTKKVYGTAITKLAKRVKKLEKHVKTGKAKLDMDANISLVPPHAEIQEKISDETEVLLEEEKAIEIISTASETPEVSTATESLVYIRRSEKKKKDKGKAIMIEDEYVQKKSKKQEQEERLGHEEAIRVQEQIDKEERKRIERDAEIAKQMQEEYDKAGKKEAVTEVDTTHVIDWNDPS
ncbi:hypothetical protein Tco_1271765, partial [Tanacetum coccineum]